MKTVVIISKCTRIIRLKSDETWYEFQFKGVCSGIKLKKILLKAGKINSINKGEEYLIYASVHLIYEGVLRGEIIKLKCMIDCRDRS